MARPPLTVSGLAFLSQGPPAQIKRNRGLGVAQVDTAIDQTLSDIRECAEVVWYRL